MWPSVCPPLGCVSGCCPFLWQRVSQIPSAVCWRMWTRVLPPFQVEHARGAFLSMRDYAWDCSLIPREVKKKKKKWMNVFSSCVETQLVNGAVNFLLGFVWKRDTRGGNLCCLQCVWTKQGPAPAPFDCDSARRKEILTVCVHKKSPAREWKDTGTLVQR